MTVFRAALSVLIHRQILRWHFRNQPEAILRKEETVEISSCSLGLVWSATTT
jgi:hypothetical protein